MFSTHQVTAKPLDGVAIKVVIKRTWCDHHRSKARALVISTRQRSHIVLDHTLIVETQLYCA